MKHLIALINPNNHGKTETLRDAVQLFHFNESEIIDYEDSNLSYVGELFSGNQSLLIAEYRGKQIAFDNLDETDDIQYRVSTLLRKECQVAVITCRQQHGIQDLLLDIAERHDYHLILFSNFHSYTSHFYYNRYNAPDQRFEDMLNEESAKALKSLIDRLVLDYEQE